MLGILGLHFYYYLVQFRIDSVYYFPTALMSCLKKVKWHSKHPANEDIKMLKTDLPQHSLKASTRGGLA